jgi:hypothetical protein
MMSETEQIIASLSGDEAWLFDAIGGAEQRADARHKAARQHGRRKLRDAQKLPMDRGRQDGRAAVHYRRAGRKAA